MKLQILALKFILTPKKRINIKIKSIFVDK
jgi:hypothetical protein